MIGELEMRLNNREAAAEQFRKAFELAETKSERAFLLKRLQQCGTNFHAPTAEKPMIWIRPERRNRTAIPSEGGALGYDGTSPFRRSKTR